MVGSFEQDLNPILGITLAEIERNPHIVLNDYVQDVRAYLAISNCLILPSYREGFPNVVLQAGAMGLPSIVTNINGCNEIIKHLNNGLIVPVKDEKALREAMEILVNDEKVRQSFTANTRKKIVEKYCQTKVWEALLAEYGVLSERYKRS